jgi:hypothetical protein
MKVGKTSNSGNILRFACCQHIPNPGNLKPDDGQPPGRSGVCKDEAIRAAETGKRSKEGASMELPCILNVKEAEEVHGSNQTNHKQRRKQTDVVSD